MLIGFYNSFSCKIILGSTDYASSVARYGCVLDAGSPTCVQEGFSLHWLHPDYSLSGSGTSNFRIENDIAILKLNTGYGNADGFPSSVGTVCLPSQPMPYSEVTTVLGWGGTNANHDQSPVLKEVLFCYLLVWYFF